jgi:hypothetical protein
MSHRKSILYHLRVLDSEECKDTLDDYDCWFKIIFWEGWEKKEKDGLYLRPYGPEVGPGSV